MFVKEPQMFDDDFHVKNIKAFIAKSNCAVHQLHARGYILARSFGHGAVIGTECWRVRPKEKQLPVCFSAIMLEGRLVGAACSQRLDTENMFSLTYTSIYDAFRNGYNEDGCVNDRWKDEDHYHWTFSAMFNLGRYLAKQYHGDKRGYVIDKRIAHLVK